MDFFSPIRKKHEDIMKGFFLTPYSYCSKQPFSLLSYVDTISYLKLCCNTYLKKIALGRNSQNFLGKFVRFFFVTLGLKILRL